jgi:hypothetical protein
VEFITILTGFDPRIVITGASVSSTTFTVLVVDAEFPDESVAE